MGKLLSVVTLETLGIKVQVHNKTSQEDNQMAQAVAGRMAGQVAQAAIPMAVNAIGNMFGQGSGSRASANYTTNQADESLRSNANLANTANRQIMEQANTDYNQRAGDDLTRQIGYQQNVADMANAAANANTARNMALNNQSTINQQYALAGDRLNQAAMGTQNALNQAANTVAGMFR